MKKVMFTAFAVGLGLTASLWAQVPSYVPTNGLVGWWPFNGNANDESGNANNGTVNGATLTADRFGNANKAYNFDGIDDFIDFVNSSVPTGVSSRTISLWFYVISYPQDQQGYYFYSQGITTIPNSGQSHNLVLIRNNSNPTAGPIYLAYNASHATEIQANFQPVISNWYHLVGVYEQGLAKLFLNSNLLSQLSVPFWNTANNNFVIGRRADPDDYCEGKIDDIGIWNRALTECEIQDLYNSQINSVAGSISVAPNPASIGSNVTLLTAPNSTNVQWQSNPSNYGWQNVPANSSYSGGTTNTLTVNNVQLSNHSQPFRVIGSNGNCTDTSNIATIQIADTCITNVTVYDTLLTTVTDTLIINTTLGLPAPNNENTILIYPNPASDHITIDNGNYTAMAGYTIKIENNAGQQVFQSLINQAQFYVDLSTWSGNGLYFVHLIDAQGNTVTVRKIVLQ
jgi:hypothetical protein